MIALAALLGLGTGTGLAAAVLAATPAVRLDPPTTGDQPDTSSPPRPAGLVAGTAARLAGHAGVRRHPWLALPTADLDLLEQRPQSYLAHRLRSAVVGLAAAAALGALAVASGWMPPAVVVLAALAGAALGGMWPHIQLREAAAARRDAYQRALSTYLDLVAHERAAGRAATPALREAAEVSNHPLFCRIRTAVASAHRHGHTPWQALRDLGTRIQLPELVDIADLAETAADGAAIATSLHTKADSLRHTALTRDIAEANSRSERLTVPVSLLLISVLGLVLYPTLAQLLAA